MQSDYRPATNSPAVAAGVTTANYLNPADTNLLVNRDWNGVLASGAGSSAAGAFEPADWKSLPQVSVNATVAASFRESSDQWSFYHQPDRRHHQHADGRLFDDGHCQQRRRLHQFIRFGRIGVTHAEFHLAQPLAQYDRT